jgi:hypothetical protein
MQGEVEIIYQVLGSDREWPRLADMPTEWFRQHQMLGLPSA